MRMTFDTPVVTIVYTLFVLTIIWLVVKLLVRITISTGENTFSFIPLDGNPDSGHHWTRGGLIFPIYCAICKSLLLAPADQDCIGLHCTDCGLATCDQARCLRIAQRDIRCKEVALHRPNQPLEKHCHHWVKGNLPFQASCDVCSSACSETPDDCLEDLKCCWCQRTIHSACLEQISKECDFGEFRRLIVPPQLVTAKPHRTVIHLRRWIISKVVSPEKMDPVWRPLIVIGNTKSGNNDGEVFLNALRGQLNPAQVVDLNSHKVEDGLTWCDLIQEQCIVLIAGGDGTIGWVMNTIDEMKLNPRPLIALLPLGTGNDLARSLGYGLETEPHDARFILKQIQNHTDETMLDRWKVTLRPFQVKRTSVKMLETTRTIFIQNYLSIGVDALVTYNFHKTRESQTLPFSGRMFNKMLYFVYGTKDVLERECKDLDQILELYLDGARMSLPSLESIVILNIPCWGAGVRPWELGSEHMNFPPPSFKDQLLEVFGVYSSFHIAQMQVGLSEPYRIGQAREIEIVLKGKAPMQTDGEPWLQGPTVIKIEHHNTIPVLKVRENFLS